MPAHDPASTPARIPASAWLRPVALLLGGALLTVMLVLGDQMIGAVAAAVFAVFMAYWTSPLRSGPHTPLADARAEAGPGGTVLLWAPGNPASARIQAALRSPRPGLVWVNVYRDREAMAIVEERGGVRLLPLAMRGGTITRVDSASDLFALIERDQDGEDGTPTGSAG